LAYRIFTGTIVLFWCVMTFLLIRLVVSPESSGFLEVPVSHVVRMLFVGGQTSELSIFENGRPVGSFSLRPDPTPKGPGRTLQFSGNLAVALPFMARQRFVWQGSADMDHSLRLDALRSLFGVRDSPNTVLLEVLPMQHVMRYQIKGDNGTWKQSFPLDTAGEKTALKALGMDANAFEGIRRGLGTPVVTARRSFLNVRHEKIEAYLVSMRQGDSPLADIYVSQLGQILFVHTSFGYTLGSEDISLDK
jgi:hypothetical protein